MCGEFIKKHCNVCNTDVKCKVFMYYEIKNKKYYMDLRCPNCNADLSKDDRAILKKGSRK